MKGWFRAASGLTRIYLVCGTLAVLGYAYVVFSGWEPPAGARQHVPAGVRHAPGGYRSYHFWHMGYHGGK